MNRLVKLVVTAASMALAGTFSATASAESGPGISDDEILICSYQPMTGKISSYFRMGKGADAWFRHVNDTGGIHGRMVNFKMVDDKYEPARTKTLVKRFIERDKCFAIVAPLGSAPTAAVIDYITSKNVPLIGAGTGAEKNLTYPSKYVFPLYPSYHMEGQELVRFASNVFGATKVGLLYQNDPSGKTHLAGIESVLDQYGVELVAAEGYDQKENRRELPGDLAEERRSRGGSVLLRAGAGGPLLHRAQEARLGRAGDQRLLRQEPEGARARGRGRGRRCLLHDHLP